MLEHLWRFTYRRIFQHLCRQGNGRYRCLKFMCHIIDKVILHLRQLLLPEYDINRKINVTNNTSVNINDGIMKLTE